MRPRNGLQFDRHLNVALAENPFFAELFHMLRDHVDDGIGERLAQLTKLRSALHVHRGDWLPHNGISMQVAQTSFHFDDAGVFTRITLIDAQGAPHVVERRAIHDRTVLINSARQLGFDYYSDTINDMSYIQLIEHLAEFWPASGSHSFIDFIGYIKQVRLSMLLLWADERDPNDEYLHLEPRNTNMRDVAEGGSNYASSHYELVYDALSNAKVSLVDIVNLFYVFAPINFVLERVTGQIQLDQNYAIVAGGSVQVVESVALPLALQPTDTLQFVGFELGRVDDATVAATRATAWTRLLNGAPVDSWKTAYAATDIRYQRFDRTVALKCYLPHATPYFQYNAVKLFASLNGGAPFAYSLHVFPVTNPKLSAEIRNDGSSWYLWVRLQLPTGRTDAVTWNVAAETRPTFQRVARWEELDVAARERHDQFVVAAHYNVPTAAPHVVFGSEGDYYGVPLVRVPTPASSGG